MITKKVFPALLALICGNVISQELIPSRHAFLGYNIGNSNPVYQNVNQVPDGQSGVTALAVGDDGNVYGGTSATPYNKSCYLIMYKSTSNLVSNVYPLENAIKGQRKIGRALASGVDGYVYGGTSIYEDTVYQLADSIRNKNYAGGHLFRFKEGKIESVEDLGIVLQNEGIRTIAIDKDRRKLYGLTEPGYHFFVYDIAAKKLNVRKDVDLLKEKDNLYIFLSLVRKGLALAIDKKGNVWGSADKNRFFRYNPANDKLEITEYTYPASFGHGDRDGIGALVVAPDGLIYGGTQADGLLFSFNPETGVSRHLGKPAAQPYIRSLAVSPKGKIFGVVGPLDYTAQIFTWENGAFELFGQIRTTVLRTDYNWYASDIIPCVYLPSGMLMFGNAGRIGKLFAWYNNIPK